jgi:nucleolin
MHEDSSDEDNKMLNKKRAGKGADKKVAKKVEADSDSEEEEVVHTKKAPVAEASAGEHNELFVKNLSWKTDENSLAEFFGTYGTVTKTKLLYTPDGKSKGIAFVEFSSNSEAKAALDDGANLNCDGRDLTVNYSGQKPTGDRPERPAYGGGQGGQGDKHTAFVGNLPFKADENALADFFKKCGGIVEVRLAKDRDTGKLKGFGHIDFENAECLQKAMEMNGSELDGRQLKVDVSTPKSGGSGGRGGFGGGRGGGRGGDFRGGRGGGRGFGGGRGGGRGRGGY